MPEVIFNGPSGRLEGRYRHSKIPHAPLALVLHPEPQLGGTMNHRINLALYQSFVNRGFSTLRFNFRGVGRSQGVFDEGEGELCDAAAALDWLQGINKESSNIWVGGFSFGAYIAMQLLMRRPEIDGYVAVAPPTNTYDFSFLAPCPADGLIVHGNDDVHVDRESIEDLVDRLVEQRGANGVDLRCVRGACHFFKDKKLETLMGHIDDHLEAALGLKKKKAA